MKRPYKALVAVAALAAFACSEELTVPSAEPAVINLPQLLVSNAVVASAVAGAGGSVSSATVAGGTDVTFVSLPPGTLPEMVSVRIRNTDTGEATPSIPVVEGGFDPVPVAASEGHELELTFTDREGAVSVAHATTPDRRPPVVVRTNPPRGRTDVVLSILPTVVFSEPIDRETLAAGVRLLGPTGAEVEATVRLLPNEPWTAELVPASALEPETTYELVVATEVRDLDGDALEEEVRIDFRTATPAASGALEIVSGNDQPGKAGSELPEPFVVRVTDSSGDAATGVEVTWTVTSGEGVLDGLWAPCCSEALSSPVPTTFVRTDADGLARIPFMPTWFGRVTVRASVPGAAVTFTTDASDADATLEVMPGYGEVHDPWVWAHFGRLRHPPLVVTVKDGQGNPVPHIAVDWRVESGEGWVSGCCVAGMTWSLSGMRIRTRADGFAGRPIPSITSYTGFTPTALGPSTVTATVPGVGGSPVTFEPEATVALIFVDAGAPYGFIGPDGVHPDVVVPVGTRVEFVVLPATAHLVSTAAPPGGDSFDSGILNQNSMMYDPEEEPLFGFVPNVAGTWTFVDQINGGRGTLTATAP